MGVVSRNTPPPMVQSHPLQIHSAFQLSIRELPSHLENSVVVRRAKRGFLRPGSGADVDGLMRNKGERWKAPVCQQGNLV